MMSRFQGDDGERRIIEALMANRLVEHDENLARRIFEKGQLAEFLTTTTIIEQGGSDDDLFLILSGEVDVFVNGRYVATRGPREPIGEMALLEPSTPRSAKVVVRSTIIAIQLPEPVFHEIAFEFPRIWRPIAQIVAERLRQRTLMYRPPNPMPFLFIGCSTEGLGIAEQIKLGLKHAPVSTVIWHQGVFGPSGIPVDDLIKTVQTTDFAAFVFGPDDKVISRKHQSDAPRDNVLFELGMFMGVLGRDRTFIIRDQDNDIKVPSDITGMTPLTYKVHDSTQLASAVGDVCTELKTTILRIGVK